MVINAYDNIEDFLGRVQPILGQHEVANNLMLGIGLNVKNSAEHVSTYLATVEDDDGLIVAALMTPPFNIVVYGHRDDDGAALALLIEHLRAGQWPVPGVIGQARIAGNFAAAWQRLTGEAYRISTHQRAFALKKVMLPRLAPGRLRQATGSDLELVARWTLAFFEEAMPGEPHGAHLQRANSRIHNGEIYLWELDDAMLVSMAAISRPILHTISVGLVYTPPEYRGMGYASNCVAALSQHMLDRGWQSCNLFTDLANPISNSIYQKMGYQAVCDYDAYHFADASD